MRFHHFENDSSVSCSESLLYLLYAENGSRLFVISNSNENEGPIECEK